MCIFLKYNLKNFMVFKEGHEHRINSSVMSLQYIYAIQNAVDLFEDYGWTAEAEK